MIDKDIYKNSVEELRKLLKEANDKLIKDSKVSIVPSYDDYILNLSSSYPIIQSVYAKFPIREILRKDCKHEQSTIVIESDENGNKSQRTICSICSKLLPKSEINQDSVI